MTCVTDPSVKVSPWGRDNESSTFCAVAAPVFVSVAVIVKGFGAYEPLTTARDEGALTSSVRSGSPVPAPPVKRKA